MTNYGSVNYEGKEYTLTGEADFTGRYLEHNNNYFDVEEDEEFNFEMSAPAVDNEGNRYTVYWMMSDVKGENEKTELDMYDYDTASRVEED